MMADHRPELPVAPLRAGNWQLSPENTPINGNQSCNQEETKDLKALALSRLQKIRGNKEGNQQATGELPTMQLPPPVEATEVATPEEGSGRLDWLEWIDNELPLLREDREYVFARLITLPPGGMKAAARRYVRRWQEAAAAEPKPHRKENAGRRAANQSLLYLIKPGSWCGCPHRRANASPASR